MLRKFRRTASVEFELWVFFSLAIGQALVGLAIINNIWISRKIKIPLWELISLSVLSIVGGFLFAYGEVLLLIYVRKLFEKPVNGDENGTRANSESGNSR